MGAVTWDIMKGMTFRSEFGFENNSEEQRRFWGMETSKARSNNNQPVAEWSMKQGTKWQLTNVWNYNFMLKEAHDIRLMLGQEIKHNQTTTKTYSTRFFRKISRQKRSLIICRWVLLTRTPRQRPLPLVFLHSLAVSTMAIMINTSLR